MTGKGKKSIKGGKKVVWGGGKRKLREFKRNTRVTKKERDRRAARDMRLTEIKDRK